MDLSDEIKKEISKTGGLDSSSSAGIADSEVPLINSISGQGEDVKQYSISEDGADLEQLEAYMDDGSMGSSVFRSGWLQANPKLIRAIIRSRPMTKTDAFRNWFGQSKAVNKEGEPLLVFHGTQERFSEFDAERKPIWFSNNLLYAKGYAAEASVTDRIFPKGKVFAGADSRILPAYIRAENPVDLGGTDGAIAEGLADLAGRIGVMQVELMDALEAVPDAQYIWQVVNTPQMAELIRAKGYKKLSIGYDYGVDPAVFVRMREILPQYDANGSGSYSHDEIEAAIDAMSASGLVMAGGDGTIFYLTAKQKATLWQLLSTSKSAKNNPYDSDTGWEVLERKK